MMKQHRSVILLVFALLVISACSPYDEGPAISLRSPEKRLSGLWEFSSVSIAGVEYLTQYQADSVYLRLSISGSKDQLFIILVKDNRASSPLSVSTLTLNEDVTELVFALPQNPVYLEETEDIFKLIPAIHSENSWIIQRLSMNELWINTVYEGTDYNLKLSKLDHYLLDK